MSLRQAGILTGLLALMILSAAQLFAQDDMDVKEIGRTTEKEIKVVLSSSFGTVIISRGDPEKVLVVESKKEESGPGMDLQYSVRDRVGYVDLTLGEDSKEDGDEHGRHGFHFGSWGKGAWHLKFSDAIPISFDIELGVGKGSFDCSGLQIKDFNLSTGASEVTLVFDEPNRVSIENLNIESGLSRFEGRNLGNANFKHFRFQGGVGSTLLDFSGKARNEVDVDVEVGLGVLTMVVPDEAGAKVYYEKSWASRLDCAADFHESNDTEYISDNYYNSPVRMNIRVDSGLGSVKIKRK